MFAQRATIVELSVDASRVERSPTGGVARVGRMLVAVSKRMLITPDAKRMVLFAYRAAEEFRIIRRSEECVGGGGASRNEWWALVQ